MMNESMSLIIKENEKYNTNIEYKNKKLKNDKHE